MNQYEREQVDKICVAWWRWQSGEWINEIAREGKNMLGEKGVFGGGEKPEVLGSKVDKAKRREEEIEFMKYSEIVFNEFTNEQRWALIVRIDNETKHKKDKARYPLMKPRELAEHLNITYDQYRDRLRNARAKVLRIDKQLRPYVYKEVKA